MDEGEAGRILHLEDAYVTRNPTTASPHHVHGILTVCSCFSFVTARFRTQSTEKPWTVAGQENSWQHFHSEPHAHD